MNSILKELKILMLMNHTILFVDDDPSILNALRRVFLFSDYSVHCAHSGKEGLDILKHHQIDLVISDFRMPEMNGYQFLNETMKVSPLSMRVILSGFMDKDNILKSVINGVAQSYLFKPWDNEQLLAYIQHLFSIYATLKKAAIITQLNLPKQLPAPPQLYVELNTLISENSSLEEITECIEKNPTCCTNILRITNSAVYGMATTNIQKAISFIGLNALRDIVFSTTILDTTETKNNSQLPSDIIEHLIEVNTLFNALYKYFNNTPLSTDLRTLGFFHDIGKVFMCMIFPQPHPSDSSIVALTSESEQELFGIDHALLGAAVLDWWNFPSYAIEVSLFHHNPLHPDVYNKDIIGYIALANTLSDSPTYSTFTETLDPQLLTSLSISEKDLSTCIIELHTNKLYQGTL
ncbi:MAG: response regulator [Fibrobacterales bacterium]